jgi:hypothetical protein
MSNISITRGIGVAPVSADIEFVRGNDGIAVPPNATTHILYVVGDNTQGINVTGVILTNTNTITALDATTAQKGVVLLADNPETIAGTDTTKATTPDDIKAKLGAQTLHGLAYGNSTTGAVQWLAEATDGQIPIGDTGGVPILANITSSDGSVTITNGAGSIDLSVTDQATGLATTIGAVTADPITFNLGATPGNYNFQARISAYESTTPTGGGLTIISASVVTTGAAGTLVNPINVSSDLGAVISTASIDVVPVGNTAVFRVTGVATFTIKWVVDIEWTFSS